MTDALDSNRRDKVASALRATAGMVPGFGPILCELVGEVIPGQRMDRLSDFIRRLEERMRAMEESDIRSRMAAQDNLPLVEEAFVQAARAASAERRGHLAALVVNALTREDLECARKERLLGILREMNDVEILILKSMHNSVRNTDFFDRHGETVRGPQAFLSSPQPVVDGWAVHQSYKIHLEQLGLVQPNYKRGTRDEPPALDEKTGKLTVSYYSVSALGDLLLRYIDELPSEEASTAP